MASLRASSGKYPSAYIGSPPSESSLESGDEFEDDLLPRYPIFESSSGEDTADEDEQTVMLAFRRIYEDPHQATIEMLDGLAGEVLRTGKITVAGSAGG